MSHETSSIQKLDSEEVFLERTREIFQKLQAIDQTKVRCMMGMVVSDTPDGIDEVSAHAFVLGSDEDIAKMFVSLVTVTRNGIVQANTPPTHNDEVKH